MLNDLLFLVAAENTSFMLISPCFHTRRTIMPSKKLLTMNAGNVSSAYCIPYSAEAHPETFTWRKRHAMKLFIF